MSSSSSSSEELDSNAGEQAPTADSEPSIAGAAPKCSSKKTKKPAGTFASMGLSRPVLRAVDRKGYKLATPIQRKCIPTIISGRDVVAMARTGSGKSAAFLLPIIDKLKIRQPKAEIRALILAPTRELAMQTFKFVREFSRFTNLVSKMIIGGESMGKNFEIITSCPDILVATPGRLAHVLVEMKQKLDGLEVVVFDEADRLFESGFKELEQVDEICRRLPEAKQTLLFSATIPQKLADFAKTGLNNPSFVRLDVESNLSDSLTSVHLLASQRDKFAVLLCLLKNFVSEEKLVVVFMPTKHHIEYSKMLLDNANIDCCHVYSSSDPEARKIAIARFRRKESRVMLVTDIAARGIDIPLLDVVINFNFPFKPKLYIHRVGRVARAGRPGCAISLVSHDETPYLHALHVFFGLPITLASQSNFKGTSSSDINDLPDKVFGTVPQNVLDVENEILKRWHEHNDELNAMVKVCENAMKPYLKTREPPAPSSVKAAKDIHGQSTGVHPLFDLLHKDEPPLSRTTDAKVMSVNAEDRESASKFLDRIRAYKPQATIFEVGHIKGNSRTEAFEVMQKRRQTHNKLAEKSQKSDQNADCDAEKSEKSDPNFKRSFEDSKFYIKYQPEDYAREKGLELDKGSFNKELNCATMDLIADDEDMLKRQKHQMVWDRKRKRYVKAESLMADGRKGKKIKTESGAMISASYSSGLYEKWKGQTKFDQRGSGDEEGSDSGADRPQGKARGKQKHPRGKISLDRIRQKTPKRRRELKSVDEMFKERRIKDKREAILRIKTQNKARRNAQRRK